MKRTTTLAAALILTSCHPAHAQEVLWITDLSGKPVAQVTRTGNAYWLYDGDGTPTGMANSSAPMPVELPYTVRTPHIPLENVLDAHELSVYNTNMKRRIRQQ